MSIRRVTRAFINAVRGANGAEIAEAALVLPLVFTFLLGIVWFARAFNTYSTITQAAQQGAIVAARSGCATCVTGTGWRGTSFPNDATVSNSVVSVLQASSIDPAQILSTSPSPGLLACPSPPAPSGGACTSGPKNIWICRAVQLNPSVGGTQPIQCGTVVSFQYPFAFNLPFTSLDMQTITLTATAQSRMEN